MHRKIIAAIMLATVSSAPVGAQTMLDKLLTRITKPKGQAVSQPVAAAWTAAISPAQTVALDKVLATPVQDAGVSAARTEAASLIRSVLVTAACAKNAKAWNALNQQHLTPKTWNSPGFFDGYAAMTYMKYHDATTCLDVSRVGAWSKPANNALSFRAWFVAADSGEAQSQAFTLQKSGERQWLIREIGHIA